MVYTLVLLCAGCATTPELSFQLGNRRTTAEDEREIALTVELRTYFGKHAFCSWIHNSEPQNGTPFNHRDEITFDQPGCGAKWGGQPWTP